MKDDEHNIDWAEKGDAIKSKTLPKDCQKQGKKKKRGEAKFERFFDVVEAFLLSGDVR